MDAVMLAVAQVVDQVGSARERAVGAEGRKRLAPADGVAELRREDDPGEDEQVLRPLPRPQRNHGGAESRAPAG